MTTVTQKPRKKKENGNLGKELAAQPGLALAGWVGCSFTVSCSVCAPKARRTPRPSRTLTVSTGLHTFPCAAASALPVLSPPLSLPPFSPGVFPREAAAAGPLLAAATHRAGTELFWGFPAYRTRLG